MFTNHTAITLFCCKKLGRQKIWRRQVLRDVNFHGTDQLLIGDKEVSRDEEYVIRVPAAELEGFVDAFTWKAMTEEEIANKDNTFHARRRRVAVEVSSNPNNDGELGISGNLLAVSDWEEGEFNTSSKTFTKAGAN